MKKYIALFIVLIFAITGWAFPPTPPTNMASPGAIGGTTPAAGTFTTLKADHIGETTGSHGIIFDNNVGLGISGAPTAHISIKGVADDSVLIDLTPHSASATGNLMEWYRAIDSVKVGAINKNGGIFNGGWYVARAPWALFTVPRSWASMMDLQSDLTTGGNTATLVIGSEPTGSYESNPLIAGLNYQETNTFRLMPNGSIYINDTANAKMTQGLTINQGANDDEILSLKSSDVNQPTTDYSEADTFGAFRKANSAAGGLMIRGFSDSADSEGIILQGYIGSSNPTDTVPGVRITARKNSGTTAVDSLAATETIFALNNHTTEYLSVLGDGKVNFWKTANDGTNYEGLQIDPATAGNMQIIAKTAGTGTDNIDITLTPAGTGQLKNAASVITSGSGTGVTVNHTGAVIQQVYKVTTTYAAYSDSDLTKGIVIATLPAKTRLVAAYADTTVAYAGTDITAATLEVGVNAEGAAEIIAVHDVFAGAVTKGLADADMGTCMTRAAQIQGAYTPSFTGTTAVYATIDATTGAATTLADLTAGSTTFYLITERLP